MKYGRYRFILKSLTKADMGRQALFFVVRASLGATMKRIACVLRQERCEKCLLQNSCMYAQLFEPIHALPNLPSWLREVPRPFAFFADNPLKNNYEPEELLSFEMALFGKANDYLPYIIHAVSEFAKSGLGKRIMGERGRFELESVYCQDELIYSAINKTIKQLILPELCLANASTQHISSIKLQIKTPLRIKNCNELQDTLPFSVLMKAVFRRLQCLEHVFDAQQSSFSYHELMSIAEQVKIAKNQLRWTDWPRYSSRQKAEMKMGGLIGQVNYEGENLEQFVPFLEYIEKTLVGKQTSFGLGRIQMNNVF